MRALLLPALGLLAACGPNVPPPKALPPPPPPTAAEQVAAQGEDTNAVLYTYNPTAKRDPFRDMLSTSGGVRVVVDPSLKGRPQQPLQKFDIDQLRLQFTETGTATPLAMIIDPNSRGHIVHIGDFIGRNWGKVTRIGREEVTITETIADQQTGQVYPQYIPLRMPKTDQERQQEQDLEQGGGK